MSKSSLPRTAGRAGLAATAAAFLAFGLAAPAAADVETSDSSARGQYVGNAETGVRVSMGGSTIGTTLFNMKLEDGAVLKMYCIDFETSIRSQAWYLEDDWANYPGKGDFAEPAKVHWILQNGYPTVSAEELASAAGINRLTKDEALGATQAAIWHFSNGVDLDSRNQPNVKALYEYLTSNAEDLPQTAEPEASLKITPGEASGKAGETIGEFVIETSAASIPVDLTAPEGVELVDLETGEPVTEVGNGDKVGFSVPADAEPGEAAFSLETTATVEMGRLFKGESKKPTQTLVTAEGGETSVSASASATWTEGEPGDEPSEPEEPGDEPSEPEEPEEPGDEPSEPEEPQEPGDKPTPPADDKKEPTLPVTGGALAGLVAAGVAALGAGGGAIYFSRKRKAANTEDVEG